MQVLDGIGRAEAGPFFYSKWRERLRNRETQGDPLRSPRLAFAAAALLVLVFINIFTLVKYDRQYGESEADRSDGLEAFVEEYVPEVPVLFELQGEEQE